MIVAAVRGEIPHPLWGGDPLLPFGEEEKGAFPVGKARGGAPRVAGLTLGKSGHHAWALPGAHRLSLHAWHAS